ncbi:MAG: GNAT family N-acetyltransferase [Alphaproteobacteria bacterium]|nr:GNAT family N-acetyltransferase [Alphaproteobacteria bacterium]
MRDPTVALERPDAETLAALNRLIERSLWTWALSDRVKRAALPGYQYGSEDLADTAFLAARDAGGAALGVATLHALDGAPGALMLHGLFVDPPARRRGIGAALLAAAEAEAARRGAGLLVVRAQRDAADFFRARGYRDDPAAAYPHTMTKALGAD